MIITLIFKSYFAILLSIGLIALLVFIAGLYFILKGSLRTPPTAFTSPLVGEVDARSAAGEGYASQNQKLEPKKPITISSQDITAIAGGDVITTQLDLARAYIETGRKQLAKKMLEFVMTQGTHAQKEEAQRLLGYL